MDDLFENLYDAPAPQPEMATVELPNGDIVATVELDGGTDVLVEVTARPLGMTAERARDIVELNLTKPAANFRMRAAFARRIRHGLRAGDMVLA